MSNQIPMLLELPPLAERITEKLAGLEVFTLQALYDLFPEEKQTTIRGRVYRELIGRGTVKKEGKGIYSFTGSHGQKGVVINGDARDLTQIKDQSIELIIADHPYEITQGTNRSFNSTYEETTFYYTLNDFQEKYRILKDGAFLVEFLPEMKETNADYLMECLTNAKRAGLKFYAKVPWYKAELRDGKLVDHSAFVGRKAVMEDVYIFSKGKPRALRKRLQGTVERLESGASEMLPAVFIEAPVRPADRRHKAEKPATLLKRLISALTLEGETVVDQFAGSFVAFFAALSLNRNAVAIELNSEFVKAAIGEV